MYVVDLSCYVAKHAAVDVGICMPIVSVRFIPTRLNYRTRVFPHRLRPQKCLTVVKLATLSSTEREKGTFSSKRAGAFLLEKFPFHSHI